MRPESTRRILYVLRSSIVLSLFAVSLWGQQDRITRRVDRLQTRALRGNVHPSANAQLDVGALDPSLKLNHVMLMLRRSDAQQGALDQLLKEQQDLSSPNYHHWLSPEEFGDQFGISQNDAARISSWLQSEGLVVDQIARSRNWIQFSGTAGQVQAALRTNMRRYREDGELHFANSIDPAVPAVIEPLVVAVLGLDDFRPKSPAKGPLPLFTSAAGSHSLAPDDLATIYHLNPLYDSGFSGAGQRIVVIGQSAVNLTDIQQFRSTYNLPKNDPQLLLVPGTPDPGRTSSEFEADLDLEWAGAVARNANIIYVYGRNALTDAIPYAINQNLGSIITYSFGSCEQSRPASLLSSVRNLAQQANAQGITWVASSGDSGAAGCDPHDDANHSIASQGLGVLFPASLPEVTGVGGTQFDAEGGIYWNSTNSASRASAISYIPEKSWNESGTLGLSSSGGGLSTQFPKPVWQMGPGVPSQNRRAVPDVSLSAASGVGYRVVQGGATYIGGGTSASAPAFAGLLALANQYQLANGLQTQSGQGNINPNLYALAQSTLSVFHDITTGSNIVPCALGTLDCLNGTLGYTAGPGYDLVTGLGSVDGYNLALNLATQWSTPSIALLSPSNVVAGGGTFTLIINGSGFDSGTVVQWVGTPLPTTVISSTQLLATVNGALIGIPGSAAISVLNTRGGSASSLVLIDPSPGATFSSQRVTTAPPASGCPIPPPVNSFASTDTVRLYFKAVVSMSDLLSREWIAPNGAVIVGGSFSRMSGDSCFGIGLALSDVRISNPSGVWQVRVFDNGSLLFSIPFGVNTTIGNPFPASGQSTPAVGGNQSIDLKYPTGFIWNATSTANWITFVGSASGSGNSALSYQVAPNSGGARSGTITIGDFFFTVEQQAASIPGLSFIGSMPHLAAQENWTTTFTLVNKGGATAPARLSVFGDALDPSGIGPLLLPLAFPQQAASGLLLAASFDRTLSPNASLIVSTAGPQTPPVLVGSAQMAAAGSVDGFAIFHQVVSQQEAVVPMETRNASSYLLVFDNTNDLVLGVAVENVSTQNAVIGVVIRDDSGVVISAAGATISLGGNEHTAFVLSTRFPFTANRRGTIEFHTPVGGQISVLGLRFTPPNDALTTIPALANVGTGGGSIAHLASGGDGWQTTFVLVNAGTSAALTTLSFFADGTGAPLFLPLSFPQAGGGISTASFVTRTLAAGATLIVQSTGAPDLLTGSAQLSTSGHVSGFVIFRHNGQEAVVPLESRNASAYLLAFDNTEGTATGVAVNAVSTQQMNIPVVVRNDSGTQIASGSISLAANGHSAFTLGVDKFPEAAGIRGTLEFDKPATGQIGVLGIRIPTGVAHTFTTLPALAK